MGNFHRLAIGVASAWMVLGQPAAAQQRLTLDIQAAEQLRRLDIMLMVTSLRCRSSESDFSADYDSFATTHRVTMNAASARLRDSHAHGQSQRAQNRALDTISTTMANRYGTGHPWLECAELRDAARDLAMQGELAELLAAADELLASEPPVRQWLVAEYAPD